MYTLLKNKTDRVANEVVRFTRELVRTPSVSLGEKKIAEIIERKMKELEYDRVFRDEWGNVIGVVYGQNLSPAVILNSHMDTVDIKNNKKWHQDPFGAHIIDNKLYGLGASDCKSGLAAQVYAGAILKHSLLPLKGTLVMAATVAEKNGRSIGLRALVEHSLPSLEIAPSFAILGETTNLDLYYGHDGWVEMNILVEGEQPFHVEDVANGIYKDLEETRSQQCQGHAESFRVLPPSYEDTMGRRRANIQFSRKINQEQSYKDLMFHVKKNASMIAENFGSVAVKVDVKQENQKLYTGKTVVAKSIVNAWSTEPYHPLIERSRQVLAAAGCAVTPKKWQLNRLEMGTAGSALVNKFNIPTVGYGPGQLDMAHAVNECVEVPNIPRAVYGTAAVVHGLIGYPVFGWTSDEI